MDLKIIGLMFLIGLLGVIFGYLSALNNVIKKPDGVFRVDMTDPEKDIFTVELNCPIAIIPEKKYMLFKVANVGSQEKPFA